MKKFNIFFFYFSLSSINGIVPLTVALLLSVPWMIALSIWVLATLISFTLICLICLGSSIKAAIPGNERSNLSREFYEATLYN